MSSLQYSLQLGLEFHSGGTLVDRALARLSRGPASTAVLAQEVLALRGNPRAAAAAVYTLLGGDPRVQVDRQGVWSLAAEPARPASRPLRSESWVVVDVETTGGAIAFGHRVIEVGAVRVEGGRITGTYSSLVNPGRAIPRIITSLTGITEEMIAAAPPFDYVASELERELLGRVFVGHNAGFDWRFVSMEMERTTGRALVGHRLCTLRLARRILPHLSSRSLGSLAEYYGIPMERHHRALDDALATARLLLHFFDALEELGITDWEDCQDFLRPPSRRRRRRRTAFPRSLDAA